MSEIDYKVPTMAEMAAKGETPEILFWVGCAGSFDDRSKKITVAFTKILNKVGINFAVLGTGHVQYQEDRDGLSALF